MGLSGLVDLVDLPPILAGWYYWAIGQNHQIRSYEIQRTTCDIIEVTSDSILIALPDCATFFRFDFSFVIVFWQLSDFWGSIMSLSDLVDLVDLAPI